MSIEKALKFVINAVARKDHVEELCHVTIRHNRAIAYDGMLSMATPIEIGMDVMPHARSLLKALQQCDEDTAMALHVTPAGKLRIVSGNFKVLVQCLDKENPTPQPLPSGQKFAVTPELMKSLRTLAPLMSTDASRPWASGLLICGSSTFATNNIVLAEFWHGSNFPGEVIIPDEAVNTLLKIGEPPTHAQMDENSCTFFFEGDRWLRTNLIDGTWPRERIVGLLEQGGNTVMIPDGFFTEIARLKSFLDDGFGVRLYPDHFSTSANDDESGARVDFAFPGAQGHFNLNQILALDGIAQHIDFSTHPAPCYWRGGMARGVIIGRSD